MKKILTVLCLLLVAAVLFAGGKKEKIVIKSADDLVGRKIGVQSGTTLRTAQLTLSFLMSFLQRKSLSATLTL